MYIYYSRLMLRTKESPRPPPLPADSASWSGEPE